jgi:hypothetical protein
VLQDSDLLPRLRLCLRHRHHRSSREPTHFHPCRRAKTDRFCFRSHSLSLEVSSPLSLFPEREGLLSLSSRRSRISSLFSSFLLYVLDSFSSNMPLDLFADDLFSTPLQYFTLSGLKTNLGLLDNGVTWGYTILLCFVAFIGKFSGCALAAKANKFNMRESLAIGTLMVSLALGSS